MKQKKHNPALGYVGDSYEELRKVTWPTKNRAVRLTFLVLGVCVVAALFLGAVDFVFSLGHRTLLDMGPQRTLPLSTDVTGSAEEPSTSVGEVTVTDSEGNEVSVPSEVTPQ